LTDIPTRTIKEILSPVEPYLRAVDEDIKLKLRTDVPLINDGAMHLFKSGGKKVRAALVILSSGLKGPVPDKTVMIAGATEIVHAATLIHDDIIDKAFLRRGDISVSEKWGNKVAVLVGDFMYTKGLDIVVDDGNPLLFPVIVAGTSDMVQGELYQLQYSNIDSINEDHYYKIIELKTARFMAACTKLGAVKASRSQKECDEMYSFGLNLGMAFQIIDDMLDFTSIGADTGKDASNDIIDGKVTLPLLYLINRSTPEDSKAVLDFCRAPVLESMPEIIKRLENSDAFAFCRKKASEYIDHALAVLAPYPDTEFKKVLMELAHFFLYRKN
jgi:octaprenyl-diphosphate synthase